MQTWRMDPDRSPRRHALQEPGRLRFVCEHGAVNASRLLIRRGGWFSAASFFAAANICLCAEGGEVGRLKLSLSRYLDLIRYGSPGRRLELAGKVRRLCERDEPAGAGRYFDIGEFKSFEQFEIKYRQLAAELDRPGKIPAPGELDFLHAMVDRDDIRHPGGIGSRDYFFLTALVSILAPRRVIEIGTLTGFSAAIIAAAIHRQHGNEIDVIPSEVEGPRGATETLDSGRAAITVETIDADSHCSIDKTRPIGFEIPELIPDLVSTVRVHTGRHSDFVREIATRDEFGLAFIDADHRHPWPLLDVLRLAPYVQSGGWILLHDIQLGSHGKDQRDAGHALEGGTPFGAEWLFDRWPFRKIRSFHIGAIELPPRKDVLIPFALDLLRQPFEITGKSATRARRAIYESFTDLLEDDD
jgi:predicted O-methyltransferase YrrM